MQRQDKRSEVGEHEAFVACIPVCLRLKDSVRVRHGALSAYMIGDSHRVVLSLIFECHCRRFLGETQNCRTPALPSPFTALSSSNPRESMLVSFTLRSDF